MENFLENIFEDKEFCELFEEVVSNNDLAINNNKRSINDGCSNNIKKSKYIDYSNKRDYLNSYPGIKNYCKKIIYIGENNNIQEIKSQI